MFHFSELSSFQALSRSHWDINRYIDEILYCSCLTLLAKQISTSQHLFIFFQTFRLSCSSFVDFHRFLPPTGTGTHSLYSGLSSASQLNTFILQLGFVYFKQWLAPDMLCNKHKLLGPIHSIVDMLCLCLKLCCLSSPSNIEFGGTCHMIPRQLWSCPFDS